MKVPTPEIKDYYCADIPDLESWTPIDDDWIIWIDLSIGVVGEDGTGIFTAVVASPLGLSRENQRRVSRGLTRVVSPVVVERFDWPAIRDVLETRVASCAGPTWFSIQEQLRGCFLWEHDRKGGS